MNTHELDNYRLSDVVKFHDRLNPRLWAQDEHLRPEVRERLLAIAADFQEFLGVPDLDLQDITISGSNAAFNYTPQSDIDLHLVVKMPDDPVYQELFNAKKYQYNDEHDIRIGGADVELYVQDQAQPHVSQGVYSVRDGKWLSVPRRVRADIDYTCVQHKLQDLESRIQAAVDSGDEDRMDTLWHKIRDMRKTGLAQHGEFGCENLVFKLLRQSELIGQLKHARTQAHDQRLSLAEKKKKRGRIRYGFVNWIGEPQEAGAEAAMEDDTGMAQGSSTGDAGAQSTWDGVSPSTQQFLNEQPNPGVLSQFIQSTARRLGIERMPQVHLHRDSDWSETNHSFGRYDPEQHALHVSLPGRHIMDVMRTTAHELAHCRQHEIKPLPPQAGETGSDWENEAHAVAGMIMRDFADANPEYFERNVMAEDADDVGSLKWPGEPIPFPKGTVKVGVSDVYDWYKLGQQISDLDDADPRDFGKGAPQTVISFGSEPIEHRYIQDLQRLGMPTTDIDEGLESLPAVTRRAIAAACMVAGVSGCSTVGQSLNTTRDVARLAQQIERAGRAGMQEELAQELRNYARARGGDANAQNQSILYRKERELREGGWDDPVTQSTVIRPSTVRAALVVMQRFVQEFNQWLAQRDHPGIELGYPTGSSAHHGQDPEEKIYGDIDLQIVVPEVPETQGRNTSQQQGYWNRLSDQWIREQKPTYVHVNSKPGHPLIQVAPDAWVQVDLMAHPTHLAQWGRYRVTPERGTKGLLYGNLISVLGELLDLSIQHAGVQYKERDGQRMPFSRTMKNYELRTVSTDISNFVRDIFDHEYELTTGRPAKTAKIDPLLADNPGVDTEDPNIPRLARAIQGLARSFELNGMYGQGSLSQYQSPQQFLQVFLDRYTAKSAEAAGAAKFGKAATPDARARAERDKQAIAQGTQRVVDLLREASGYIPTRKQARDPRFSMALTQDVQPGETGRQANRLSLKTDSQGRPELLMKGLRNALEQFKVTGQYLRESEQIDEIRMSPSSLRAAAAKTGALAGMEFEMIIPDVGSPEPDQEHDYDMDRRIRGLSDIREFFYDSEYNTRRDVERLTESIWEDYMDSQWLDERKEEEWRNDAPGVIQNWVENNERDSLTTQAEKEVLAQDPDRADWNRDNPDFRTQLKYRVDELIDARAEEIQANMGSAYDEAFEQWENEDWQPQWNDDDMFTDWLSEQGIETMSDIIGNYDITWPYWRDTEDSELNIQSVADDFAGAIDRPVRASGGYHDLRRDSTSYIVEPDSSLDPDSSDDAGLEFVSPPLPIDELLSDLKKVKTWADGRGAYTNKSTGLHINVSVPDLDTSELDYVKLALLLGDEYVLGQFGRLANTYAKSAMGKIRDRASQRPEDVQHYMDLMRQGLAREASRMVHAPRTDKYTSINVKEGYVEFRSPGGDWLDEDLSKIENTLLRFVVALSAAADPQKDRKEYLKKLYQVLAPRSESDPVAIFARYSAGELPQSALKSFIRQLQLQRQVKKQAGGGEKYWWEVMLNGAGQDGPGMEVVATSEQEALAIAAKAWETTAAQMTRATARPIRPADAAVGQAGPRRGQTQAATQNVVNPLWQDAEQVRQPQSTPAGGTWTGRWLIKDQDGRILHSFSGIGNVQADANRHALEWLRRNGDPMVSAVVVPEMT